MTDLEQRGINVIRGLALDAVEKAKSGHQGTALALAPLAHVLFTRIMHYDATAPEWPDRDRFVLSNGHVSALLYSMLHLTGLRARAVATSSSSGSGARRTPGHPEYRHAAGVEVTTGPLGSGHRERGRHRARRGEPARAVRQRAHRSPHVRDRGRRLPLGGREPRGRVARRPPRARPADRGLRRQPHHDRRARPSSRSPTTRAGASGPTAGTCSSSGEVANDLDALEAGVREAMAEAEPPEPRGAALAHRLAVAEVDRQREGARQPVLRGRHPRGQGSCSTSRPTSTSSSPTTSSRYYREAGTRGAPLVARVARAARRPARARPRSRRRLRRLHRRHGHDRLGGEAPVVARRRRPGHARGVQGSARRDRRRRARARRRRRRPHRQHRHRGPRRRRDRARVRSAVARSTSASASTA